VGSVSSVDTKRMAEMTRSKTIAYFSTYFATATEAIAGRQDGAVNAAQRTAKDELFLVNGVVSSTHDDS
jgi:hypothetical protein